MDLNWFDRGRTLNWAHRGASGHAPQNTLPAFLLAAEMGADGIELDVHLTRDGEVVVIHDDTIDATTNGHGRIRDFSLAELQAFDAGSSFHASFAGERIPTLQQVFDAVGHRLLVNVEVKAEANPRPPYLEAEVVRLIEDNDMAGRVIISSFSPASLRRVCRLNPHLPLGFLYSPPEPAFLPRVVGLLGTKYQALHPHYRLVDAHYMEQAHHRDLLVNVWTVNELDDMRRMHELGVDGIITNYPDRLQDVLSAG